MKGGEKGKGRGKKDKTKKTILLSALIIVIAFMLFLILRISLTGYTISTPSISGEFVRGDVDGNSKITIGDAINIFNFLFTQGPKPNCLDAADVDDSGTLTIGDSVYLLNYLFSGGKAPPAPFPEAGVDPTPDSLTCGQPWCSELECCKKSDIILIRDEMKCFKKSEDSFAYELQSVGKGEDTVYTGYRILEKQSGTLLMEKSKYPEYKEIEVKESIGELLNSITLNNPDNFYTLFELFKKTYVSYKDTNTLILFFTAYLENLKKRNLLEGYETYTLETDECVLVFKIIGLSGVEAYPDGFEMRMDKYECDRAENLKNKIENSLREMKSGGNINDYEVKETEHKYIITLTRTDGNIESTEIIKADFDYPHGKTIIDEELVQDLIDYLETAFENREAVVFKDNDYKFVEKSELEDFLGSIK